jgi:hypothetical protein
VKQLDASCHVIHPFSLARGENSERFIAGVVRGDVPLY